MLSGMTNCSSGAQACLPASTLQRHLKMLSALHTGFGAFSRTLAVAFWGYF